MDANFGYKRNVVLERVLEPGNYLIFNQLDWSQMEDTHFTFSVYSEKRVILTRMTRMETKLEALTKMIGYYVTNPWDKVKVDKFNNGNIYVH